jgi:hypothetical protein
MHSLVLFPQTALADRALSEGYVKNKEQLLETITRDPTTTSRRFQWVRGIPGQRSQKERYEFLLIYCAADARVPRWLVVLAASPIFRSNCLCRLAILSAAGLARALRQTARWLRKYACCGTRDSK